MTAVPAPRGRRGWWLLLLAVCATAWDALAPGDVTEADRAWHQARAVVRDDWSAPLWVEVASAQRDVAPWQPGAARARERLRVIGAERRALLPHDRGGRRVPLAAELALPEEADVP